MPLALWYLAVDARIWFDSGPLERMTAEEMGVTRLTRVLYAIPKLGVVVGLISLLKFPRYAGLLYLACWMFALAHTAMYYRDFHVPIAGEIELLRLAVHHVIPHLFFACMVLSLLWFRRRRTKPDLPGL